MQVRSNDALQAQISKVSCPACSKVDLELRLRCDLTLHECLYLVKCRRCDSNFTISSNSEALAAEAPLISDLFTKLACVKCDSATAELGFQCDLRTRGCYYTFTCKSCGDVIKQYQ
jgi:hypothetical protein